MFHSDTRQQLIEATGRLILRLGYSKTSVGDIAHEAGLSRATAYLYFPNKDAMLSAWLAQRSQSLREELKTLSRGWYDPWQALEETLKARIRLRLERAGRLGPAALNDILSAREALLAARPEQQAAEAALFADLIHQAQPQHPKAAETALLLVLATDSLSPSHLSAEQLQGRATLDKIADQLCGFLVQAVRSGASP